MLLVIVQQDAEILKDFESGDRDVALLIEKQTFWLLVALIENLLPPEMYGQSLAGVQIQVKLNLRFSKLYYGN